MTFVNNPSKTLLIGNGYWGKIIKNNLKNEPIVFDSLTDSSDKLDRLLSNSNYVIIATPASTHFELVSKALNFQCNVFCEKPLCLSLHESQKLFKAAKSVNKSLYVDWIFLCNPVIRTIKNLIDNRRFGKLIHASMNRLNLGPVRNDVSAAQDLASHDLSILSYLVDENLTATKFEHSLPNDVKPSTSCVKVNWSNGDAVINVSWSYPIKNRTCVFSFEKATVHWDDCLDIFYINGKKQTIKKKLSPLQVSLNDFFSNEYDEELNEKITLSVASLLETNH